MQCFYKQIPRCQRLVRQARPIYPDPRPHAPPRPHPRGAPGCSLSPQRSDLPVLRRCGESRPNTEATEPIRGSVARAQTCRLVDSRQTFRNLDGRGANLVSIIGRYTILQDLLGIRRPVRRRLLYAAGTTMKGGIVAGMHIRPSHHPGFRLRLDISHKPNKHNHSSLISSY